MKRNIKLLILLLSLCILLGAYVIIKHAASNDEAQISSTYDMTKINQEEVNGLEWVCNEETFSLKKEDGVWIWSEDKDFPVNQNIAEGMAGIVSNITSIQEIAGVENFAQYGLTEYTSPITVETSDGSRIEIITGDLNDLTDRYYAMVNGSDNVYMVDGDYLESFAVTIDELLQTEEIPWYTSDTGLTIQISTETYSFDLTASEGSDDSEDDEEDTVNAADIAQAIKNIYWDSCVDYKADEGDLTDYGLDEPEASFTITGEEEDTESSFTLHVGCSTGEGGYYVRLDSSKMIYTVDGETIEDIINTDFGKVE